MRWQVLRVGSLSLFLLLGGCDYVKAIYSLITGVEDNSKVIRFSEEALPDFAES